MATMAREAAQAQPINEHSNPVISAIDVAMLQGLDLQQHHMVLLPATAIKLIKQFPLLLVLAPVVANMDNSNLSM